MNSSNVTEKVIKRRNNRLLSLFVNYDYKVRLLGDENKPAVILDEQYKLTCYVKNFDLHFYRSEEDNTVISTIKLTDIPQVDKRELAHILELCQPAKIYKIHLKGSKPSLFLTGWNYLNKEDSIGRYPVFAAHRPKIYFEVEYAKMTLESISSEYNVEIL
jgi:hypothetical protein